jgi:RNA polymerase sigma-70 factor, ECF subfamily
MIERASIHPMPGVPPPEPADTDASLVRRITAGDRPAFELLMRRYNRRLFRLARSVLGDDAEAEDALQEVYLRAHRTIAGFRGDANLSTWLSRMVLNESLGRLRKSARRQNLIPIVQAEDADMIGLHHSESPEKVLGRTEMRALIERKLDELPEDFRTVFVLRAVEELSVEESAACLDIPEATVRSRHFRARSLLREALAREIDVAERDLYEFGGLRCDRIVAAVQSRLGEA